MEYRPGDESAFPYTGKDGEIASLYPGMSIRDYFAGQVISQCQITVNVGAELDTELVIIYAERYAKTAYAIADAMIAERSK